MRLSSLLPLGVLLSIAACSPAVNNTPGGVKLDGGVKYVLDSGPSGGNPDGGGNGTDGGTSYTPTTVGNAVSMGPSNLPNVEFDSVVVVAAESYVSSGATTGTFYIQDAAPSSSTGIAVYVSTTDTVTFPAIGDIVTVQGSFGIYDGANQISSTSTVPLTITHAGSSGMSSGGAYSPAGTPIMESSTSAYAAILTTPEPGQIGNVLTFAGPLTITNEAPANFVSTSSTGTTKSEGFEVTGGLWVDDTYVYYNCMKGQGPDGGTLFPTLTNGVTGVWDEYQDYYSDAGTIYTVLYPMSCADLGQSTVITMDGGTTTGGTDGGTTTGGTDGGTTGVMDGGTAPGTSTVAQAIGSTTPGNVSVAGAVVVAAYSYAATGGGTTGTFFIQDPAPNSGAGIEVFVASTDAVTFPAIGDIVTVTGYRSVYYSQLQIGSSTSPAVTLAITKTGSGGMSSVGAYSPAGSPTAVPVSTAYAASSAGNHADLIGTVLKFTGTLTVKADKAPGLTGGDAGTETEGFEITDGIYVDDSNIYYDCMKGLGSGGGTLYPTLSGGSITGVWSTYQSSTGTTYPVLIPMACADVGL